MSWWTTLGLPTNFSCTTLRKKLISPRRRIEAPSPTARPERGPGEVPRVRAGRDGKTSSATRRDIQKRTDPTHRRLGHKPAHTYRKQPVHSLGFPYIGTKSYANGFPYSGTKSYTSILLVPMGSHTLVPNRTPLNHLFPWVPMHWYKFYTSKQLVPMGSRTVVPNPVPLNNLFLWVTIKWYQTLHL